MGPISPIDKLPVTFRIPSGLSPERTIFMEGFLNVDADWFEISLQCGPSLDNEDDIAFRLRLECFEQYCTFKTDSLIGGKWKYDCLYPKDLERRKKSYGNEDAKSKIQLVEKEIKSIESSNDIVIRANMTIELPGTSGNKPEVHMLDCKGEMIKADTAPTNILDTKTSIGSEQFIKTTTFNEPKAAEEQQKMEDNETDELDKERRQSLMKKRISFQNDDAIKTAATSSEENFTTDEPKIYENNNNNQNNNGNNNYNNDVGENAKPETNDRRPSKSSMKSILTESRTQSPRSSIASGYRRSSFASDAERAQVVSSVVTRLSHASSIEEAIKTDTQIRKDLDMISGDLDIENSKIHDGLGGRDTKKKYLTLKQIIRSETSFASLNSFRRLSLKYSYATDPDSKLKWANRLAKAIAILEDYLRKSRQHAGTQTMDDSTHCVNDGYTDDFDILELQKGQEFKIALECLENGYLLALNEELFCAYPHHISYDRVTYLVIDGHIRLEELEVEGGTGRDKTLVMDLYDAVVWSEDVIVLTDENFSELVLNSLEMWMVNAYTGWCPACNAMQWQWEKAAFLLRGKVKVGASDCDRNEELVDKLHIKYCPTIYYFTEGKKTFRSARIYDGIRLATCFIQFANIILDGHVGLTREMTPVKPLPTTLLKKRSPKIHPRKYREVNMEMDKVNEDTKALIHTGCTRCNRKGEHRGAKYFENRIKKYLLSIHQGPLPISVSIPGGMEPKRCLIIDGYVPKDAESVRLQCGPSIEEKDDIALCITFHFLHRTTKFSVNSYIGAAWEKSNEQIHYYEHWQRADTSRNVNDEDDNDVLEIQPAETNLNTPHLGIDWNNLVDAGRKSAAGVTEKLTEVKDAIKMQFNKTSLVSKDEKAKDAKLNDSIERQLSEVSKKLSYLQREEEKDDAEEATTSRSLKKTDEPRKESPEKMEKDDRLEAMTGKSLKLTEDPKKESPAVIEKDDRLEAMTGKSLKLTEDPKIESPAVIEKDDRLEAMTGKSFKLTEDSKKESPAVIEKDDRLEAMTGKSFNLTEDPKTESPAVIEKDDSLEAMTGKSLKLTEDPKKESPAVIEKDDSLEAMTGKSLKLKEDPKKESPAVIEKDDSLEAMTGKSLKLTEDPKKESPAMIEKDDRLETTTSKSLNLTEMPKKELPLKTEKIKDDTAETTISKSLKLTEELKKESLEVTEIKLTELEAEKTAKLNDKRLLPEQDIRTPSDEPTTSKGIKARESPGKETELEREGMTKWWETANSKEPMDLPAKTTEETKSKAIEDKLEIEKDDVIKWWENATSQDLKDHVAKNTEENKQKTYTEERYRSKDVKLKDVELTSDEEIKLWMEKRKENVTRHTGPTSGIESGKKERSVRDAEVSKNEEEATTSKEYDTNKEARTKACCTSKLKDEQLDTNRTDKVASTTDLPTRPRCDNTCQTDSDTFFLLPLPRIIKYYLYAPTCCTKTSTQSLPCENCKKQIQKSDKIEKTPKIQSADTTLTPERGKRVEEKVDRVQKTREIESGIKLNEKIVSKSEERISKENKVTEEKNEIIKDVQETNEPVEAAKTNEEKREDEPYLALGIRTIELRKPPQGLRMNKDDIIRVRKEQEEIAEEFVKEIELESKESKAYFDARQLKKADTEQQIKIFEQTQKKMIRSQTKQKKSDTRNKYLESKKKSQAGPESEGSEEHMTTSMQELLKVMEDNDQQTLLEQPKATPKEPTTARRSFLQILSGRSSFAADVERTRSGKDQKDTYSKTTLRKDSKVIFKEDLDNTNMLVGEVDGAFINLEIIQRGVECRIVLLCTDKGFIMTIEGVDICEIDHQTDYDLISYLVLTGDFEVIDAGVMGAGGPTRWLIHATDLYQPWEQTFVTILTDETFEKFVFEDEKPQFVTFYMNKCQFHQELEDAAPVVQNEVTFSAMDALVNLDTVERLKLTNVPVILYFPSGQKNFDNFEVYDGKYTKEAMVEWLMHKVKDKEGPAPGSGTKNPYLEKIHMVGLYRGRKVISIATTTDENTEVDAIGGDLQALELKNRQRTEGQETFGELLFKSEYDISLSDSCIAKERRFRTFLDVVMPSPDKNRTLPFNYEDLLGVKVPVIDYESSEEQSRAALGNSFHSKVSSRSKQLSKCEYVVDDSGKLIKLTDPISEEEMSKSLLDVQSSGLDTQIRAKSEITIPINLNQRRDISIRRRRRRCCVL